MWEEGVITFYHPRSDLDVLGYILHEMKKNPLIWNPVLDSGV